MIKQYNVSPVCEDNGWGVYDAVLHIGCLLSQSLDHCYKIIDSFVMVEL